MKHTLPLRSLDDSYARFSKVHELAERPRRRTVGTEPFGPFVVTLGANLPREDWEGLGSPLTLEIDL